MMNDIELIKKSIGSWEKVAKLLFDVLSSQPNQETIKNSIDSKLPVKQVNKISGRKSRVKASIKNGLDGIGLGYRDGMKVNNHEAAVYVVEKAGEYYGYTPINEEIRKKDIRNLEKRISDADPKRKKGTPRRRCK
jgi:hypothetical protein